MTDKQIQALFIQAIRKSGPIVISGVIGEEVITDAEDYEIRITEKIPYNNPMVKDIHIGVRKRV